MIPYEERSAIVQGRRGQATLDGLPAIICGARCDTAMVVADHGRLRGEWAWVTVARVLAKGGDFRL